MYILISVLIVAYLIGSIPFAVVTGYILTKKDIRTQGSKNAGATNVFRILGWKAGLFVLVADFLKAFFPVLFAPWILEWSGVENFPLSLFQTGVFICVILGHIFPLFAKFKGGKGVASAAGGISAIFPPAIPFCLIVFTGTIMISRYVSLASLLTAWILPFYYFFFSLLLKSHFSITVQIFFVCVAILITLFHRSNIKRLIKGEEKKIQFKRKRGQQEHNKK